MCLYTITLQLITMKKSIFTIILWGLMFSMVSAQENVPFDKEYFPNQRRELRKAIGNYNEGVDLLKDNQAAVALEKLKKAHSFNPDNADLNYMMGRAFNELHNEKKAIEHLKKAYKLGNMEQKNFFSFQLAKAYHYKHQFSKAIIYYKKYLHSLSPVEMREQKEDVRKKIEECNTGKRLIRDSLHVHIEQLSYAVNTKYDEYSPYVNADQSVMYFTSRRPNTTGGGFDEYSNGYYEDVYVSYREDGQWTAAANMGRPINTEYHDAAVGISPDGQKLYIYRWTNGGDIFKSELKGDEWSKPKAFGKPINSSSHEPTASFTHNEKGIYFVSDRNGGYGGSDIYYVEKDQRGKWRRIQNLGPTLNTPYDEDGVFMHPDGKTLYFSSKGHNTMGGYDIFKAVKGPGGWSEPENIGYPINTADDDVFFSITASGRYGYYASKQEGNHDIYRITFMGPKKPVINTTEDVLVAVDKSRNINFMSEPTEAKGPSMTLLKGKVMDEETQEPLQASIELVDNATGEELAKFNSNSKTGRYLVSLPAGKNYGIAVDANGYLFHSENFNIPRRAGYNEVTKDIYLKPLKVGKSIVLNNVFFDFDVGDRVKKESIPELNRVTRLIKANPDLKIEIAGHTDVIGSAEYNKKLSLQRAKTVVDYLVKNGVDPDRLVYKGYGFNKPVADNSTPEGRQKNRRTEFKIIGKYKGE